MAQALAAIPAAPGPSLPAAALSADELREIQEYDRIVQFRDSILSGKHPRIKVPASSAGKIQSSQPTTSQPDAQHTTQRSQNAHAWSSNGLENLHSSKTEQQQPSAAIPDVGPSSADGVTKPFGSSTAQFDPLFLTKSEELVKAELQIQRQRLERALRDELEERRAASKTTSQLTEQVPDFDLSDILAKALTLVQATAPPPNADANEATNAQSDSSDSFDENTFYSNDIRMRDASSTLHREKPAAVPSEPAPPQDLAPSPFLQTSTAVNDRSAPLWHHDQLSNNVFPYLVDRNIAITDARQHDTRSHSSYIPHVSLREQLGGRDETHALVISSNGSGTTSRSDNSGHVDPGHRVSQNHIEVQHQIAHRENNPYVPREPLIRAHDLSPFAPQPSHVSPLATARQPPVPEPEITILHGAPAGPVAVLRQEQGNATSPESSPQGERGNKKRQQKKQKRREARAAAAAGRAANRPASPYIKPEPQSPSPIPSPQFVRPQKRPRLSNRSQHELNYDESRGQAVEVIRDDYQPRPYRDERVASRYESDDLYSREVRHSVAPGGRLDRAIYEERRPEGAVQYVRRLPSPPGYSIQYTTGETRPMRSATFSLAEPLYREPPSFHSDGRVSVRPSGDGARSRSPIIVEARPSVMPPPRPPTRIIRDPYGREYIEPVPSPSMLRQSVGPPGRRSEHEVIYERISDRPTARLSGPETFERDGVVYRSTPPILGKRRVVTHPEHGTADYRDFRQHEYPARPGPAAQASSYYHVPETRNPQEVAPEYGMRSASVRPAENVRYEYPRLASVRPDVPVREYATSIYPEARREIPVYREYSVRPPAEPEYSQRELSSRPIERYYNRPVAREDVQFIEQPRAVHREIVYEDGSREVYR
ncbi:hypothetical protein BX600DRAFT_22118 [Xylariales sp. PMI_506]|nr:hypothetical protein BX600DRAFT_22118 [Xylariales sp. PMI_506]